MPWCLTAGLFLWTAALAGCRAEVPDPPAAVLDIRVCGSTTLGDEVFPEVWQAFTDSESRSLVGVVRAGAARGQRVRFVKTTSGSMGAADALAQDECDLGLFAGPAGRPEGASEELHQTVVGKDLLVVLASPDLAGREISLPELKALYTTGVPGIAAYGHSRAHGTGMAWADAFGIPEPQGQHAFERVEDLPPGRWVYYDSAQVLAKSPAVAAGRVAVLPVVVDGAPQVPALDTLLRGEYPLTRDLTLLWVERSGPVADLVASFVAFVRDDPQVREIFERHYMLHARSVPHAAPASGRCVGHPPAIIEAERAQAVRFRGVEPIDPLPSRAAAIAGLALDGGRDIVLVAYASDDGPTADPENCRLAEVRGRQAAAAVRRSLQEIAPSSTREPPKVHLVLGGPTRFWGLERVENQRVVLLLADPRASKNWGVPL